MTDTTGLTTYGDVLDRYEQEIDDLARRLHAIEIGAQKLREALLAERARIQSIRIEVG